ncbi:hypothetical protein FHQ18_09235 [Deferribacter autotrophicus]|uniref:Uncharacterized protein n=1 Tax=Deferribacter autotrophicus TaxID=500465 RepID=A0A5A8F264_9BACT|nr:hypothetical protein [Deferribacter autotrophicus]KAA0257515.1 hypothetical protein FHQ18_09235 [Deferribacter autotrophicus]
MIIQVKDKNYKKSIRKHAGCRNFTCQECGIEFDYMEVAINRFFCPVCGAYMDICNGCGKCGRWN